VDIRANRIKGFPSAGLNSAEWPVSLYIYAQSRRTNPTGLDEADEFGTLASFPPIKERQETLYDLTMTFRTLETCQRPPRAVRTLR
jgi:hypothetical protein